MAKRGRPSLGKQTKRMTITFEDESLKCLKKLKADQMDSGGVEPSDGQVVREALIHYQEHRQEKDVLIGVDELKFFQSYIGLVGPTTVSELLRNLRKSRTKI